MIPVTFLPRLPGSHVHAGRRVGMDAYGDDQYVVVCGERPRSFAYEARGDVTCPRCLTAHREEQMHLDPWPDQPVPRRTR